MTFTPPYVIINDPTQSEDLKAVLRRPAAGVEFPLSSEDQTSLALLEAKFDQEEHIAGLAAPQIGISKRMIIFAAPDDPDLRSSRQDHEQVMPKTIWLNPSYLPVSGAEEDLTTDFEACFSVQDLAGPVERFTKIAYKAFLPTGKPVSGQATGFLARVIQHEIDHLNGILFIDKVLPEALVSIDQYRQRQTIS